MIRVLGLALYGPLAASNRYRVGQYIPGLLDLGIELQTRHLLGDDYLRAIFSGKIPSIESMLKAGLARLADLYTQKDYDIIMLQCELFPLLPGLFEREMLRKPYLYDFDDAFYLKYRSGRMHLASPILGTKFDTVMAGATTVTAGNRQLATYARQHNTNTYLLPTVVDTSRYLPQPHRRGSEVYTVGWIGSPSTST